MTVRTEDIGGLTGEHIRGLQSWEKFQLENSDLEYLLTEIRKRLPDYTDDLIRVTNNMIFINNQIEQIPAMIPSTEVIETGAWDTVENWIITPDKKIREAQNWGVNTEDYLKEWQDTVSECLKIYVGGSGAGSPKFKIINREDYSKVGEIPGITEWKPPRVRIDIQRVDGNLNLDESSDDLKEWTIGYYSISNELKGSKLKEIVSLILGENSRWNNTPGIIIFSNDGDEGGMPGYKPLSKSMNLIFKLAMGVATTGGVRKLNHIFLEGVWNDLGKERTVRMHEFMTQVYEEEVGMATLQDPYDFASDWKEEKGNPAFHKAVLGWFEKIQDSSTILKMNGTNSWEPMRWVIQQRKENITAFLECAFWNYEGDILEEDGFSTTKNESIYQFLQNNPEIFFKLDSCRILNYTGFAVSDKNRGLMARKFLYSLYMKKNDPEFFIINQQNQPDSERDPNIYKSDNGRIQNRFITAHMVDYFSKDNGKKMLDNIIKYFNKNAEAKFDLSCKNFKDKEITWDLKRVCKDCKKECDCERFKQERKKAATGENFRNILLALDTKTQDESARTCFELYNSLERKFQREPHIGEGWDVTSQLMKQMVEMKTPYYLTLYKEMIIFFKTLKIAMDKYHATSQKMLGTLFSLTLNEGGKND